MPVLSDAVSLTRLADRIAADALAQFIAQAERDGAFRLGGARLS